MLPNDLLDIISHIYQLSHFIRLHTTKLRNCFQVCVSRYIYTLTFEIKGEFYKKTLILFPSKVHFLIFSKVKYFI